MSSGIEVQIAAIARPGQHDRVGELAARLSVGIPVAVFVLVTAVLVLRPALERRTTAVVAVAVLALVIGCALPLSPAGSTVVEAVLLTVLVAVLVSSRIDERVSQD